MFYVISEKKIGILFESNVINFYKKKISNKYGL